VTIKTAPRITVTLSAPSPTVDLAISADRVTLAAGDGRTIAGDITAYNTVSTTQHVVIHDGALTPRDPIDRVKLLRDHNQADPIGYMTSLDAAGMHAEFYVPEGENGDRALAEARDGLRDGLSIGFHSTEYGFDDDLNFHVYAAELYEVSLCAIPDMQSARVTDVAALTAATQKEIPNMNRAQLAAALSAGTISQATYDVELRKLDDADRALAANVAAAHTVPGVDPAAVPGSPAPPAELAAGPQHTPETAAGPVQVVDRGLSLAEVTRRVSLAARTGQPGQVALALADVLPAHDAGEAFIQRKDWIGELFQARQIDRPWIDSFGVPAQLTSLYRKGFRITERPQVAPYEGNKKAITSAGTLKTAPAEFTAKRWAGGWDIDRAFVDLGQEDYLAMFWAAAVEEYLVVSDEDIAEQVLEAAEANTAAATGVLPALTSLASSFRGIKGAQLNRIKMAGDLFDEYASLTKDQVPFWLANATSNINLLDGTVDVAQLVITTEPEVPDGTVVGYDSRAAKVLEKAPIQVQAVDIAKGGVDLGLYSYGMFELHDARLFQQRTVVTAGA
jgi:HK97 family phage prohead protease